MSIYLSGGLLAALNETVVNEAFNIVRSNRVGVMGVVDPAPARRPYEGYKMSWLDMAVSADGSILTAGVDAVVTTIPVADGSVFRSGMAVSAEGSDEVMLVTSVSSNNLTVVRAFGGTTAEAVLVSVKLVIDSVGREENSLAKTDNKKQPDIVENYFQTFDTAIEFSRRALSTMQYGNTNDLAFQISERIRQLAIDMNRALIRGRRAVATIGSDQHTFAGGLRFFTDQSGAIKTDAAAATLTLDMINDINAEIVTAGGTANTIAVGVSKARKLSALVSANYSSQRLADWTADEGSVLSLPTDLPLVGNVNTIVVDTNLNDDELMIFDSSMISVVPMDAGNAEAGGNWRTLDATQKGQDGQTVRIIGDYSYQVRNSKTNMARLHNIG